MKNLVVQTKLEVWNEVVERANSDFEAKHCMRARLVLGLEGVVLIIFITHAG